MKTFADEIAEALPAMLERYTRGPTAAAVADWLLGRYTDALDACRALDKAGRAIYLRYPGSKARHLVPLDFLAPTQRACANCRVVFDLPPKSVRACCGRSCGISWSWRKPGVAEKRRAGINAERATPQAKARAAAFNAKRWGRPGERERLAEQNRAQWADPVKKAKRSASIQAVNGSPQNRAKASHRKKQAWATPEYRDKTVAGIRASKSTPEARALFSKLLKARWQDPVLREKYLAAVKATCAKRAGHKQSAEQVAKRVEATRRTKAQRAPA